MMSIISVMSLVNLGGTAVKREKRKRGERRRGWIYEVEGSSTNNVEDETVLHSRLESLRSYFFFLYFIYFIYV